VAQNKQRFDFIPLGTAWSMMVLSFQIPGIVVGISACVVDRKINRFGYRIKDLEKKI